MTANQINYWANKEQARHNLASETETNRSNVARETETNRSNLATEVETHRSNVVKEKETERHNRHQEVIGYVNAAANTAKAVSSFLPSKSINHRGGI